MCWAHKYCSSNEIQKKYLRFIIKLLGWGVKIIIFLYLIVFIKNEKKIIFEYVAHNLKHLMQSKQKITLILYYLWDVCLVLCVVEYVQVQNKWFSNHHRVNSHRRVIPPTASTMLCYRPNMNSFTSVESTWYALQVRVLFIYIHFPRETLQNCSSRRRKYNKINFTI